MLSRPSVKAGQVEIELQNDGEDVHDLRFRRIGGTRTYLDADDEARPPQDDRGSAAPGPVPPLVLGGRPPLARHAGRLARAALSAPQSAHARARHRRVRPARAGRSSTATRRSRSSPRARPKRPVRVRSLPSSPRRSFRHIPLPSGRRRSPAGPRTAPRKRSRCSRARRSRSPGRPSGSSARSRASTSSGS